MAENSDYLKEQRGIISIQRVCYLVFISHSSFLFRVLVSDFREGSKDSEGEGTWDLQRKKGKRIHPVELQTKSGPSVGP